MNLLRRNVFILFEYYLNLARASENLNLDATQPTTTIQIRLADGSRLSGRFNLSHTVDDLRAYIVK